LTGVSLLAEAAEWGYQKSVAYLIQDGDDVGAADYAVAKLREGRMRFGFGRDLAKDAREAKYGTYEKVPAVPSMEEHEEADVEEHSRVQDELEASIMKFGFKGLHQSPASPAQPTATA